MKSNLVHPNLLAALENLEQRYHCPKALDMDPLRIPLRFKAPADQELAAWVAAHLAYGRVAPMLEAIHRALAPLGEQPSNVLRATAEKALRCHLEGALESWVWRFQTRDDLIAWVLAWKRLDETGGLEAHLCPTETEDADSRLSGLVQRLRTELPATHGIRFLLPDPLEGAACKRWRLFLRWMVRTEWPDLGIWQRYPAASLTIPLDTHVARISGYLGFSVRRTANGLQAQEITQSLQKLDAQDPLRFDFALSHLGIMGDCPSRPTPHHCESCPLIDFCQEAKSLMSKPGVRS